MVKKLKFIVVSLLLLFITVSSSACLNPTKVSARLESQIKFQQMTSGGGGSSGGSQSSNTGTAPSIYGKEERWCNVISSSSKDGLNYCIVSDSGNYDTGITIYSTGPSASSSPTNSLTVNSNNFYVDFTTANRLYTHQYIYQNLTMNLKYRFEILKSDKVMWYIESTFDRLNSTYYMENRNVNGSSTIIYMTEADYANFQPISYGKKSLSLSDGDYKIKITRHYQWLCAKNSDSPSLYETDSTLTATLLVDGTKPVLTAKGKASGKTINNNAYVNELVTYTASDTNHKYIYYKKPTSTYYGSTTSSTYTTDNTTGWWSIYSADSSGNLTDTHTFYFDSTKPTGKVISNGIEVTNNTYITTNFIYVAEDNESGIKGVYYKSPLTNDYVTFANGSIITPISGDGWYSFYAIDNAGNQSEITSVYLESAIPTLKIYRNNEPIYGDTLSETGVKETNLYFNLGDTIEFEYDSSSDKYTANFEFDKQIIIDSTFEDSAYTLSVTTATGIKTDYIFHVVHNKPSISIDNEECNESSTMYFSDDKYIEVLLDKGILDTGETGINIVSSGDVNMQSFIKYTDLESIKLYTSAGTETIYELTLNDRANNVVKYTIVIDKKNPTGIWLNGNKEVPNNGYSNSSLKFEYEENISQIFYSKDNSEYKTYKGQTFYDDGVYNILIIDLVGNKSMYTATIDKIAPKGHLYANYEEVYSGTTVNGKVIFTWDGDATATCNGEVYEKNTVIWQSGIYRFVLTDQAENESKYTITIAGDLPSISFNVIDEKLHIDIVDAMNGAGIKSIKIYHNGEELSDVSMDIKSYVYEEVGVYKVSVIDGLNRTTEKRFDFIKSDVEVLVPDEPQPDSNPSEEKSYEIIVTGASDGETVTNEVVINEVPENSTYSIFLNGKEIDYELGNSLTDDGTYQILVVCDDGTTLNYSFEINNNKSMNGSSVLLIVILAVSISALIVLMIYKKKGFYKK